jgi:hypothetical protein
MADRFDFIHQIMMVHPIDPDLNESEQIEKNRRQHHAQTSHAVGPQHFQLQHQNCNDDGDDAVRERL